MDNQGLRCFVHLRHHAPRYADVDGRRGPGQRRDEAAGVQDVADQFGEGVRLARLQRLGLDDQIVVTGSSAGRYQVHADRCGRRAVVGGGELVDDRRDARRGVHRRLRVIDGLRGNEDGYCYGHGEPLYADVVGDGEDDGRGGRMHRRGGKTGDLGGNVIRFPHEFKVIACVHVEQIVPCCDGFGSDTLDL